MSGISRARAQNAVGAVRVDSDFIPMVGGLDEVTPPLSRKPGTLKLAQNFEQSIYGGYRRIHGYERFDGRAKPSDAFYSILNANITGSATVGQTLTGATSGATGVIIALTSTYFALTKVSGTFQGAENLNVGGPTIATAIGAQTANAAPSIQLHTQYLNLAADQYRADIQAVPGSGATLGVWLYNDVVYAFRNNAGATAAVMHKSTATGWAAVALGRELAFTSGGTYEVKEGDTITGATSAATAVVTRVALETGTFAGGTAAGRLIFASQTGTFQAENLNVGANLNVATIAADSAAITLAPSGKYEFKNEDFLGNATAKRMYGASGVHRAFEFDGTVFVPIKTGMSPDTPKHVTGHKKHLFLSFGGSVQHSAPGTPYIWSPVLGAAELGMGDTVTGFGKEPGSETGGALPIFTRNRMNLLYGTGVADWELVPYRDEVGAFAYTIQDVGYTIFLDDRGITDLTTVQAYGNFAHAAISDRIRTSINENKILATASAISRDKNQYRVFFSNGKAFYVTHVGRKIIGIMPVLFNDVVRVACSLEKNDGSEAMFFGSDGGFVFQMDRGTSFDGDTINFYIEMSWNFAKSPRVLKRYRDVMLEIEGAGYAQFEFGYSLGYGSTDLAKPVDQTTTTNFSASRWDAFTWDAFFWDGTTLSPSILKLEGEAENISLAIRGDSDHYVPFTLTGAVIQHTPRRRLRA